MKAAPLRSQMLVVASGEIRAQMDRHSKSDEKTNDRASNDLRYELSTFARLKEMTCCALTWIRRRRNSLRWFII